jgi:hypothetical protein
VLVCWSVGLLVWWVGGNRWKRLSGPKLLFVMVRKKFFNALGPEGRLS